MQKLFLFECSINSTTYIIRFLFHNNRLHMTLCFINFSRNRIIFYIIHGTGIIHLIATTVILKIIVLWNCKFTMKITNPLKSTHNRKKSLLPISDAQICKQISVFTVVWRNNYISDMLPSNFKKHNCLCCNELIIINN